MGPYCKFCGQRCFAYFPDETPAEVLERYSPSVTIIATCPQGQEYERHVAGYCYDDIKRLITLQQAADNLIIKERELITVLAKESK